MIAKINRAIMQLTRRSEQQEQEILNATFVNIENLLSNLASIDHQIIFGRRGTGKTHVLRYFREEKITSGDMAVYIDMRNLGSDSSIYNSSDLDVKHRAKKLLLDAFNTIINEIFDAIFSVKSEEIDERLIDYLEKMQDQLSSIKVIGAKSIEEHTTGEVTGGHKFSISMDPSGPQFSLSNGDRERLLSDKKASFTETEEIKVVFSGIGPIFNQVAELVSAKRIWILLDEWAAIPTELQPILCDLMRRTLLTCRKVSVKIGAIEIGSRFIDKNIDGSYTGIELGADIQADISLDDFMVFGNDGEKASDFFAELFRKHLQSVDDSIIFASNDLFISSCFTQKNAFIELVRASEGVPRDAINILRLAATKSSGNKFAIQHIRTAARLWYERDKSTNVSDHEKQLLEWIIDKVIKGKKARGFLLGQEQFRRRQDISSLINSRVLHITKRGISAKENPGVRYDVYSIDYGCYVELLTTSHAPDQLDPDMEYSEEVPFDDNRSLRRAILDLDDFEKSIQGTLF